LYETSNGNIIKAIAIIMQITIKKLLVIEKNGGALILLPQN